MTERLRVLADSYLDHIRIAVEADDRGAPFRDFLDNWNAYRTEENHHRSRGDRVRWFNNPSARTRREMLESLDFCSRGAAEIMAYAAADPGGYEQRHKARDHHYRLVVDHAVPISLMVDMLFSPRKREEIELDRCGIEAHLKRFYRLGLISHADDAKLRAAGLNAKMPDDWGRTDPFARYRAAGLMPVLATTDSF